MSKECAGGSCGEGDGGSKEAGGRLGASHKGRVIDRGSADGGSGNGGTKEGGVIHGGNIKSRGGKSGPFRSRIKYVISADGRCINSRINSKSLCYGGGTRETGGVENKKRTVGQSQSGIDGDRTDGQVPKIQIVGP